MYVIFCLLLFLKYVEQVPKQNTELIFVTVICVAIKSEKYSKSILIWHWLASGQWPLKTVITLNTIGLIIKGGSPSAYLKLDIDGIQK